MIFKNKDDIKGKLKEIGLNYGGHSPETDEDHFSTYDQHTRVMTEIICNENGGYFEKVISKSLGKDERVKIYFDEITDIKDIRKEDKKWKKDKR